jgi:hypothetical protein
MVNWSQKVFDLVFQYQIADSSNTLVTNLAGESISVSLLSERTVKVEVVDCTSVITLASDKLLILQDVGLNNKRVSKTDSEEFTFVLNSGDGFRIEIKASTTTYEEVCGSLVYSIELSDSSFNDYISFDGTNLLTINTNKEDAADLTVTVRVKNTYFETDLITTTFLWRSCEV